MTKEEIIEAVHKCVAKLGRTPRTTDFYKHSGVSIGAVRKNFGTFTRLLRASSLEEEGPGFALAMEPLFLDWAKVTRKLGKIPTKADYSLEGRYSVRPFTRRFGSWSHVPDGMKEYATRNKMESEWEDVLKIIREHREAAGTSPGTSAGTLRTKRRLDRPIYGRPMLGTLSFTPTNEQGVIFLFGAVGDDLGFFITRVQTEFPDLEALREVGPNQCQRMTLEAEYESRNFLAHMHPLDGCDAIVCWIHNWPECPLEVIELKSVVEKLAKTQKS